MIRGAFYDSLPDAYAAHPGLQAQVEARYRPCAYCTPGMAVMTIGGRVRVMDLAHDDDCPRVGQPMLRAARDGAN
jgi:hypothetical protein